MLGKRDMQGKLTNAVVELGEDAVSKMGFYGKLAAEGHKIFRDDEFAEIYCTHNGRPSVPPSILGLARLLQFKEKVSDAEVVERCKYDLRWKVALDLDLRSIEPAFAKSTFQAFRARLTLHIKEGMAFEKSIQAARKAGLLPPRLRVALDSSPVRGRGAVKDTFNLLSDAIVAVVRAVAEKWEESPTVVARTAGVSRHLEAASIKGSEMVDWNDEASVGGFLKGLLEDCDRAVCLAEKAGGASDEVELLKKVIAQDVDRHPGESPQIRKGVAKDRTISIHDPQMRHGHKSKSKSYNGHKVHIAVEVENEIITAVDMTAPADPDGADVKGLVEQSRETTGRPVDQGLGDTAYSSRTATEQAEEAHIELVTKMPASSHKGRYGPADFQVSENGQQAVCPAGVPAAKVVQRKGGILHVWAWESCQSCPDRSRCTIAKKDGKGSRTLLVAPDFHDRRSRERYAQSEEGRHLLRERVAVEHAFGRLKNRGAGTARYFGRGKTLAQVLWTAAVVNFSMIWRLQGAPGAT